MELALQHLAVARHEEAEDEVDHRGEDVGLDVEALPLRVGERRLGGAEQVEEADDDDQRGVLEHADEGVDQRRDHHRQRLRQHDQPGASANSRGPSASAASILALRDRLQAAADDLGEIGGGEQDERDLRAQQLVDRQARPAGTAAASPRP